MGREKRNGKGWGEAKKRVRERRGCRERGEVGGGRKARDRQIDKVRERVRRGESEREADR